MSRINNSSVYYLSIRYIWYSDAAVHGERCRLDVSQLYWIHHLSGPQNDIDFLRNVVMTSSIIIVYFYRYSRYGFYRVQNSRDAIYNARVRIRTAVVRACFQKQNNTTRTRHGIFSRIKIFLKNHISVVGRYMHYARTRPASIIVNRND